MKKIEKEIIEINQYLKKYKEELFSAENRNDSENKLLQELLKKAEKMQQNICNKINFELPDELGESNKKVVRVKIKDIKQDLVFSVRGPSFTGYSQHPVSPPEFKDGIYRRTLMFDGEGKYEVEILNDRMMPFGSGVFTKKAGDLIVLEFYSDQEVEYKDRYESIKIKQQVDFLPYAVCIYNKKEELHVMTIAVDEGHPQTINFKFRKELDLENLQLNQLYLKIEGMSVEQERMSTEKIPIKIKGKTPARLGVKVAIELYWYGDGEKEFPIMINGLATDKESNKKYWEGGKTYEIIKNETGSNMTREDALFLDGDKDGDAFSSNLGAVQRKKKGMEAAIKHAEVLFSKLGKNEDGKITQRIQVYTHSRGSVYGDGFIYQLEKEIKKRAYLFAEPDNVIDIVIHMDAHQSEFITVKPGAHPTILISHKNSVLGDSKAIGDVYNIETDSGVSGIGEPHKLGTFKELDEILDQHNSNELNDQEDKYIGYKGLFGDQELKSKKGEELTIDLDKIDEYNRTKNKD